MSELHDSVRAICLWQPYASLVAAGLKTIETRLWSTGYRGQVVVCGTKAPAPKAMYEDALRRVRERGLGAGPFAWGVVPAGTALAVVTLTDCRPMTPDDEGQALVAHVTPEGKVRTAWVLGGERTALTPFPVKGRQGWFRLPASQIAQAVAT